MERQINLFLFATHLHYHTNDTITLDYEANINHLHNKTLQNIFLNSILGALHKILILPWKPSQWLQEGTHMLTSMLTTQNQVGY